MSETTATCDLCGLPIEGKPFVLHTSAGVLRFCCDGCRGIYRLLNDVDELPEEPGSDGEAADAPSR
jgi:hypothetical protein